MKLNPLLGNEGIMGLEVQETKTCKDCNYFVGGNIGTCSAMWYDLSFGTTKACEHFEEKEECNNIKREQ